MEALSHELVSISAGKMLIYRTTTEEIQTVQDMANQRVSKVSKAFIFISIRNSSNASLKQQLGYYSIVVQAIITYITTIFTNLNVNIKYIDPVSLIFCLILNIRAEYRNNY